MAKVLVTEDYLSDIGDAIRGKLGGSTHYTPGQMASAINSIPTVAPTLISKSISVNGTYNADDDNADGYDSVSVNVPNSYSAQDEGKVVSSGALVGQTSRNVTVNGTYDTTTNNEVVVNVPTGGGSGTLIPKTVTQNGTYNASDDNADGYSQVTVSVSGGDSDEILYNHDYSLNTTGETSWDGTNSGTSQTSRMRIIDGWEIMQCTAEKTASGIKVVPKMQYAYLTATIPAYWFSGKTVTIYAVVNGTKYEMTGVLSSYGASVSYNTPFGQLYFYAYNTYDIVFTLSFNNQINQEFVISDTSMKLSTSS